HGAEAGNALGHGNAHNPAPLAFDANTMTRDARLATPQESGDQLHQLMFVDGTAAQLEIDAYMIADRRAGFQRVDVLRSGVDGARELFDVGPVPQRLNAAGRRARADGHQILALPANLLDPPGVMRRGDRAFDKADIVRASEFARARFQEVGNFDVFR